MQHFHEAQAASQRHQRTPHFFVNYNQLPDILWDHVLPTLNVHLKAQDIHKMEKVASVYTQGRKPSKLKVFPGDQSQKQENVPDEIQRASDTFMVPTYAKLEALKEATLKEPVKKDEDDEG